MLIQRGATFSSNGSVTNTLLHQLVDSATGSNIVNADIDSSAAIADSKLAQITTASKISGAAITGLASLVSGAGVIPTANLGSGTASATTILFGDQSYKALSSSTLPAGTVLQVLNTVTGSVATGTTGIPADDTIPQNTEGDQYMSLAITPAATTNNLLIQVTFYGCNSAASSNVTVALFQDSTANALRATSSKGNIDGGQPETTTFSHFMAAGTTSATTFKVRAGGDAGGTTTFNGQGAGTRRYGGVAGSSITITEIKV